MDTATSLTPPSQIRQPLFSAKIIGMFIVLELLIWLSIILPFGGILMVVLLIAGMIDFLTRRRWILAGLLLMLSPLAVSFFSGIYDYATGQAQLRFSGYPAMRAWNLDPQLRCEHRTSGCMGSWNDWVREDPYNFVVGQLTQWFGPMRGAYVGPYPTEAEAKSAIATGVDVSTDEFKRDRIVVGGEVIQLDRGVGKLFLTRLMYPDYLSQLGREVPPIKATVWQGGCVIVRIPVPVESEKYKTSACLAVFDRQTGRPFAYYSEGGYSHSLPPVYWRRQPWED